MALLEDVLDASGGIDAWQRSTRFTAHLSIDGALLAEMGKGGLLKDVVAVGSTQNQLLTFIGFTAADKSGGYRPDRVTIERLGGGLLQERDDPRATFVQHTGQASWDDLDLVYFCGFALWTTLTMPFVLTLPNVRVEELAERHEPGHVWRRLRAVFPPEITTHAAEQVFSFDASGLQWRTDYTSIGAGDGALVDHASAHQNFSGIVLPTLRRSLRVGADGTLVAKPAALDIEIFDASFA
jgi:hypothetical protein